MTRSKRIKSGFSLIEVLVGTALFLTVAVSAYGAFANLLKLANASKARTLAVHLADEQFEIIRNMPYISVGLTNGIPLGILPQTQSLTRGGISFTVSLTVRNINLSTSTVQASDKLIEVEVDCPGCQGFQPVVLTGQVSPANLQSAGNGGALVVQVFDANGQPVHDATVVVQSLATSTVTNTDTTNNDGVLNVIGVPPGPNMYRVTVNKSGYSTDRTYPLGGSGNPDPTKPDITILDQQVSQASFAIDRLSTLHFSSVTPLCVPVGGMSFDLAGAKQIGTNVSKYSQSLSTDGSGMLDLPNMEWDTYAVTPTDTAYDVAGINPYSPFSLNPGNSQSVQLVVVPKDPNSLLISIEDNASKLPVSGATVELSGPSSFDETKITGQGYLSQTDWSGGGGQNIFTDQSRYLADNGQTDTSTSSGDILMKSVFGSYNTNIAATLESSTFDTGTSSNFYTFSWTPANQPALAGAKSVKFQFAANPTSTSTIWSYTGPDGTAGTFYEVPGSNISAVNNGNEFVRYMAYLSTETATVTPMISDVSFAYTSSCIPPGQVLFQGLSAGSYTLTVSKVGYATYSGPVEVTSGWHEHKTTIGP
ncbi:MAG: carboxypeptidase regulatory-like domain-containing protein [Candidatus Omnitrophota bacterium]|jgi:prepilin-type N-terminal cleavage/methylation domain-containing protein